MSKISILMNFVRPFFDELYIMCAFEKPNFSEIRSSFEMNIKITFFFKDKSHQVFMERPFCQYSGHTSDLLDVSWSKNYFILTSSMDKTVRLWHISR